MLYNLYEVSGQNLKLGIVILREHIDALDARDNMIVGYIVAKQYFDNMILKFLHYSRN